MPYRVSKVPGKECWQVKRGSVVHSRCTTLAKAKAQVRLLNQLDHRMVAHKKK